ncbi:MAG: hypothetical protein P857_66 [Candidatus Xenolissoclinum pacificiensis L6]|uniref:Uncharacterized protein n=1 Tax=Candidatus Xenolissoclinum pacificiensis L6 TaxID=1401685 RepID=W2UZB4_9RICK|nr:MAG: hypothetical protein P857_66 [Candidatus Xenolissoclinum pacificiensis L6]
MLQILVCIGIVWILISMQYKRVQFDIILLMLVIYLLINLFIGSRSIFRYIEVSNLLNAQERRLDNAYQDLYELQNTVKAFNQEIPDFILLEQYIHERLGYVHNKEVAILISRI